MLLHFENMSTIICGNTNMKGGPCGDKTNIYNIESTN